MITALLLLGCYILNATAFPNEPRIIQFVPNKQTDNRPIIITVPESKPSYSSYPSYNYNPYPSYPQYPFFPIFYPQQQQQQQQQQQSSGGSSPYIIILNPTNRNDHDITDSNSNNNNPSSNNDNNNNNNDNNNNDNNNNNNDNNDNNNNNQNDENNNNFQQQTSSSSNNNNFGGLGLVNGLINRNFVSNGPNGSFVRISHISDSTSDSAAVKTNLKTIYYGRSLKTAATPTPIVKLDDVNKETK